MTLKPDEKPAAFARLYEKAVLGHPLAVVLLFLVAALFFGYHLKDFRMDASSDSLVLENDSDLRYYEETRELFGSDDYVILAFTLEKGVMSQEGLDVIEGVSRRLNRMGNVASVDSILTVPLFQSPEVSLFEMGSKYKTLRSEGCNRGLAFRELTHSPLWSDNLISKDGKTAAIVVSFKQDPEYDRLRNERYRLRRKRASGALTLEERRRLDEVTTLYTARHAELSSRRRQDVREIRGILADYRTRGYDFVESGLPMIVADMVSYIERDIYVFGAAVALFLAAVLSLVFRQLRWTVLPLVTCLIPVVLITGYLGLTGWETTVVTSNFSSLLLIISMQNCIYLIVRFREIHARFPERGKKEILFQSVVEVSVPCLFASTTAMVGFAALAISGIRPVIDFGLLMAAGLGIAYAVNFVFFPAAILLFPQGAPPPRRLALLESSPVSFLARFSRNRRRAVLLGSGMLLAAGIAGMTKLQVENRFIDYFRTGTPISRGLTVIDNRMGGTTSLEIVLDGKEKNYWLKPSHLALLHKVHAYAESMPNVGKVTSLDSLVSILTAVNNGNPPNEFILNMARVSLSDRMQQNYLRPYVTSDFSEARVFVRIRESSPTLRRDEMLTSLHRYLEQNLRLPPDRARVTGIFVLYNNLLKSLFDSQIKTLGLVFIAIYAALVLLFRSFYLALIGIVPATLPIFIILGAMGWLGISLDIMTIMIASITMGIAVDNMIQYTFRYRREFRSCRDYAAAMDRSHNSIGLAILYSNLTIITGFAILALSKFIPTVYFGLFAGMAMAAGFSASLTLLPMLLSTLKPFGKVE